MVLLKFSERFRYVLVLVQIQLSRGLDMVLLRFRLVWTGFSNRSDKVLIRFK